MRQDLHLYIGGKEVEFSSNPKILFNFKETELRNPTVIKNTFSKQVTIDSSPANDDIFNHFWNLERKQEGSDFNAMTKVPFELYDNGDLIQKGYVRLDSIKMSNHRVQYQVSLFGGLGDFFYSLSYAPDSSEKKSLASLQYTTNTILNDPDLDFVINKETVADAWNTLMGQGTPKDKWRVINFAPTYNGIPQDFDANKVLINTSGYNPQIQNRYEDGGDVYLPVYHGSRAADGFVLGELSESLTCDETFDLRSYLQRPVVNVQRVLQACCRPENNGGYEVRLDDHFFHNDNPYWTMGWMTLPMLRNLNIGQGQSETVTGATISSAGDSAKRLWNVNFSTPSLSSLSNAKLKVSFHWTPAGSVSQSRLYTERTLNIDTGPHIFQGNTYVEKMMNSDGICIQLWAMDENGGIAAASDAYLLGGSRNIANDNRPLWQYFYDEDGYEVPDMMPNDYHFINGTWMKNGSRYDFCDAAGNAIGISFTLNTSVEYTRLVLKIKTPFSSYAKYAWRGELKPVYYPNYAQWETQFPLYTSRNHSISGDYTLNQANDVDRVWGALSYTVEDFEVTATDYEGLFSNTLISKNKLLATSFSPCDFLVSYAKMFGLYFYRNPSEVATDPVTAPNGVIHIMDRDTFFTGDFVDLESRIDRSRDMTITPAIASTKWYSFSQESIDSEAEGDYSSSYGKKYGSQLVNTGYEFDNNTTNLYDGSAFKSGIMVREKDKYFTAPLGGFRDSIIYNGFKYTLFAIDNDGLKGYDIEVPVKKPDMSGDFYWINNLGLAYYDLIPKLQCHGKENGAVDGDSVLLFYNGPKMCAGSHYYFKYWITDDVADMINLNGGTPCWLFTNGDYIGQERIALTTQMIPHFTRDLIVDGEQEGNISHSWNFGHPMMTFVPNVYTVDGDSIYDNCWKDYIRDLYSVDNRKVSCYVNLKGVPAQDWLRKWWWFDNSIWRLNEIKDWNAAGNETTLCEFIKVQDPENYTLNEIHDEGGGGGSGVTSVYASPTTITNSGGNVSYTISLDDCGTWDMYPPYIVGADERARVYSVYPSVTSGTGCTSTFIVPFPQQTNDTDITWTMTMRHNGQTISTNITQTKQVTPPTPSGETIVFDFVNNYTEFPPESGWYGGNTFKFTNVGIVESTISASTNMSWCTVGYIFPHDRELQVRIDENTGEQRAAILTLYGRDSGGTEHRAYMDITQYGASLTVYPNSVYIDFDDANYDYHHSFDVYSNNNWTITLTDI